MPSKAEQNSNTYDTLIIGAGIAGLHAAVELLKRGHTVAIAEKYKLLGGRAMTFNMDLSGQHYQWEEGAGRISNMHVKLLALLRRYKLGTIPIGAEARFRDSGATPFEPASFEPAIPIILAPLLSLPKATLANNTIRKLLTEIHGPKKTDDLLIRYPYRAELDVMRADMALEIFRNEFGSDEGYSICREGLSELVLRMEKEIVRRGGKFLKHHELVRMNSDSAVFRVGPPSEGVGRPEEIVKATNFVFALPSETLKGLDAFKSLKWLRHITMKPLLRVFAVFDPASEWLQDLKRTITGTVARYIIPNNPKVGSVQISYTDSTDAEPLIKLYEEKGEAALGKYILDDLRTVLQKDIPAPIFVKAYPWKAGVSYWLPGDYDPYEMSRQACKPFPEKRWFLCGESFSTRQCWIEGSLEHTDMMLKVIGARK